jgi:hypothetical protein
VCLGKVANCYNIYHVVIKTSSLHVMKALGWRGSIAPTHSRPPHLMGVHGQHQAQATLYPGERTPDTDCTGGEPRSHGRPAHSQTIY